MQRKWRERYPERFGKRAVERMNSCGNISQLAIDLHVCRILLYKWRDRLHAGDAQEQRDLTREAMLHNQNIRLKRVLGEKALEVDFFKVALQKVEARRQNSDISGGQASTMQFVTPLQGSLSIERMCQLTQVSRAGFYRYLQSRGSVEESMTVRSAIQEIALEHRLRYGYRRITAELRRRGNQAAM